MFSGSVRSVAIRIPTHRRWLLSSARTAAELKTVIEPAQNAQQLSADIRTKLKTDLKTAMKAKDTVTSTTIRSVLAEVTNLEKKQGNSPASDASVFGLIKKAVLRRQDAAAQFRDGARTDLAEKEEAEAALLSNFLPPPLTADEIERFLSEAASSVLTSISAAQPGGGSKAVVNNQALVGKTLKAFWANVPAGSAVSLSNDDLLKRIKALLEEQGL